MTYLMLGAGEIALGALAAGQYFLGDSGLNNNTLLISTAMMATLASWRSYCLFVRPDWVEARSSAGKAR